MEGVQIMANISDAFGEVTIEKVGQEFLDFLKIAQKDGYYLLVDGDLDYAPDSDGDLSFDFSSGGRWAYANNLDGYLGGEWMNSDEEKEAHAKFLEAIEKKKGKITIDYTDGDMGLEWIGTGVYEIRAGDEGLVHSSGFEEEEATITTYMSLHNVPEEEAVEYIRGEEVAQAFTEYKEKEGDNAKDAEYWLENIYKED